MQPKITDLSSISDSDIEKYRAELADLDISDDEKEASSPKPPKRIRTE